MIALLTCNKRSYHFPIRSLDAYPTSNMRKDPRVTHAHKSELAEIRVGRKVFKRMQLRDNVFLDQNIRQMDVNILLDLAIDKLHRGTPCPYFHGIADRGVCIVVKSNAHMPSRYPRNRSLTEISVSHS